MTAPEPSVRPGALIPAWLVNLAALGWRITAVALLLVVTWMLVSTLWVVSASIAVAVVIAAAFAPFALRLRARGRSRTAAAAIVWALALLIIGGALLLLAIMLLPYVGDLVTQLSASIDAAKTWAAGVNLPPLVGHEAQSALDAVRGTVGGFVGGIVASAAGVITVAVLATFLVFFFLRTATGPGSGSSRRSATRSGSGSPRREPMP